MAFLLFRELRTKDEGLMQAIETERLGRTYKARERTGRVRETASR